nr:hypothetical protein [Gammaproteobacteria bacterium]
MIRIQARKLAVRFLILVSGIFASAGYADDTDVYLKPSVPSGAEPLVIFALDYRSNLGATA